MRSLFEMDKKDYTGAESVARRPSVRGIILKDGQALLIWSKKYDYYMFPGGGIKEGESHIDALCREVLEETGYTVVPESVREYGHVLRKQLSLIHENEIFEQDCFYYFCEITGEPVKQCLEDYEEEEELTPKWMLLFDAHWIDKYAAAGHKDPEVVIRESRVLEMLDKDLRIWQREKEEEEAIVEMAETGRKLLGDKAVSAAQYREMLEFVKSNLSSGSNAESSLTGTINYSRFTHIKRVLGWARRLYAGAEDKEKLDYEACMISTIFHDVGRNAADALGISHAAAGEPITKKYLLEHGFAEDRADYIKWLVGKHSDKHLMGDETVDRNLLLLMEADTFDEQGALGVVMDAMIVRGRNADAGFEDAYDHIMRFTYHHMEYNPMVTPEGRAMFEKNAELVRSFATNMKMEMSL